MQTKSNIQILAELVVAKNNFFEALNDLQGKYEIENNVFCCGLNGVVEEPEVGYFGQVKAYENLAEAKKDFNPLCQGLRITKDKVYIGNLYKNLSDVKEQVFVDLAKQTIVE